MGGQDLTNITGILPFPGHFCCAGSTTIINDDQKLNRSQTVITDNLNSHHSPPPTASIRKGEEFRKTPSAATPSANPPNTGLCV